MAASFRGFAGRLSGVSFCNFGRNFYQKIVNLYFDPRTLHHRHYRLFGRQCCVREFPHRTQEISSSFSSRVITPITAELLKGIQYGRERWMDQGQRLSLGKKYENGIIDHHSGNYEKLTLEHFQVFWPDGTPIWKNYRRNFLGQFAPKKTREKCIRRSTVASNPCPLCRLKAEKNYALVYSDVGLLSQFICQHSGLVLEVQKTGVCRQQQKRLEKAVREARDKGLIPFTIPGPRDPPRHFKAAGVPFSVRNKT
ncbi:uncharacterized protein [Montipora foliosa]|uniref:uncharacterized protein isoform X1 n=2 Tax=Montipora foliosa TaxID=591990 RepID=UPI0035F13E94